MFRVLVDGLISLFISKPTQSDYVRLLTDDEEIIYQMILYLVDSSDAKSAMRVIIQCSDDGSFAWEDMVELSIYCPWIVLTISSNLGFNSPLELRDFIYAHGAIEPEYAINALVKG